MSISACFRIPSSSAFIPRPLLHRSQGLFRGSHRPTGEQMPNHLLFLLWGLIQFLLLLFVHLLPFPGSKSSGSNRSNSENSRRREKDRKSAGGGSSSGSDPATWSRGGGSVLRHERPPSQLSHRSHVSATLSERSPRSHHSYGPPGGLPSLGNFPKLGSKIYAVSGPPGGPPVRELSSIPPELTGSRQSFQKAMGNPCEFFVDIM